MNKLSLTRHNKIKAQTFLEYILLFGLVVSVMVALSTMLRRPVQSVVHLVADQVGNQKLSDQSNALSGHLDRTSARTGVDRVFRTRESGGVITYETVREDVSVETDVLVNVGFTKQNP